MDLQTKVEGLYAAVSDGFYRNIPELEVTTGKTRAKYNSALLFSTLTALNNGKILLFGEYGGGKTTSSEYVLSLFRGIPLDILQSAQIRGHPELTEEKTVGRPDLAKMNRGIGEEVVWEFFPLLPGHIIDEINRIPESKQSIILEGVGRGIWRYLREIIFTGKTPLFATNNYADKGNMELIPPMKDRFDVAVESRFPGVEHSLDIMLDYENPLDERLRNEDISAQMREALQDGRTARERLAPLLEQYRGHLAQSLGVETLSAAELRQISEEIRATPLDQQATMLMRVLMRMVVRMLVGIFMRVRVAGAVFQLGWSKEFSGGSSILLHESLQVLPAPPIMHKSIIIMAGFISMAGMFHNGAAQETGTTLQA